MVSKKINVLLPALIKSKEHKKMTERCKKTLVSFDHCINIEVDNKPYDDQVAGVWNAFFDRWRGKKYDYLMIVSNDIEADPLAIDFMVKFLEENQNTGIVTAKVERKHNEFIKNFGQQKYSNEVTNDYDTPCFMIRQGVIEEVGKIDSQFPVEFVENDYFYRVILSGRDVQGMALKLFYHPKQSMTVGYDNKRYDTAFQRYFQKWGGDAKHEKFSYPYNDIFLNFTFCKR